MTCSRCHAPIYLAYQCGNRHCLAGCPTRYLHVDPADHPVED